MLKMMRANEHAGTDVVDFAFFNDKAVLITGASGMLGSAFLEVLLSRATPRLLLKPTHAQFDVSDSSAELIAGLDVKLDLIIHCAAIVDADHCEECPLQCFEAQVGGMRNIITLARLHQATIFYPQSFLVYGEEAGEVDEQTNPAPLSVYGKCKLEAERLLLSTYDEVIVVRMGGFFGGEKLDKNFVGWFVPHCLSLLRQGTRQMSVGERVWQPSYTIDLAYNSLLLIARRRRGVYNMASYGQTSFYELAKEILTTLGLERHMHLFRETQKEIRGLERATRPYRLVMRNRRLQQEGLDRQRDWRKSLHDYLQKPYFKALIGMNFELLAPCHLPFLGSLKNRVVMSAMTRGFADQENCATGAMLDYYKRRADGGVALLLTEGIVIHQSADGYNNVPHLFTDAHVASWKPIVEAVHSAGSKIFAQLWHCGRISHEDYTGGLTPVSSSDIQAEGINRQNNKPFAVPRALQACEMADIYEHYAHSARLALESGFDGVEVHLGHGYLADSFFDSRVNVRVDNYGGSIENRCRFALELVARLLESHGEDKVMVRISPSREMNGETFDWPDLIPMIDYLIPAFDQCGLRMLDISCARADYARTAGRVIRMVRPLWPHILLGGASLDISQAQHEIDEGFLDLVTWGRTILANPDFVKRIRDGTPMQPFQPGLLERLY
jgi:N-ethylmaleimide reductase